MTLAQHPLQGCLRYDCFLLFALCLVGLGTVTLPSQLEYFCQDPLPVQDEPTPERLSFLVSPSLDCVYPQSSVQQGLAGAFVLSVFVCEEGGGHSASDGQDPESHKYMLFCPDSVFVRGQSCLVPAMRKPSEYLVSLFSSVPCAMI